MLHCPWVEVQADVIIREGEEGESCLLTGSHHYLDEAFPASVTAPTFLLPALAPASPRTDQAGTKHRKQSTSPTTVITSERRKHAATTKSLS